MELANVSNKDDEIKKMECVYTYMHMHIYVHMCVCLWTCMCLCTHAHSCLQRNFIQPQRRIKLCLLLENS